MSQDQSLAYTTARSTDPERSRSVQQPPGSLSLAATLRKTATNQRRRREDSFVTPEYAAYHYGAPDQDDDRAIWSLAKPLPHLVRPGMRRSSDSTRAPNRPEDASQWSHVESRGQAAPNGYGSRDFLDQQQSPFRQPGSDTHAAGLPRVVTAREHDQSRVSEGNTGHGLSRSSTHDFATEDTLSPSRSEQDHIDAGRLRLQEIADTQSAPRLSTEPTARIDWEEYYPQQRQSTKPRTIEHRTNEPEFFNTWAKYRYFLREPLAEFLGTLIFMLFGLSASLVSHLVPHPSSINDDYGNFVSTNLAWGWGSMIGIYVAGGVSGAHLNPMISITLAIYRGFPWRMCWKYIIAQLLASFIAALIVYAVYSDALAVRTSEVNRSSTSSNSNMAFSAFMEGSNTFYMSPNDKISPSRLFFTQFLQQALFMCCILAMGDDNNAPPGAGMNAFIIGLLIFVISTAFPFNSSTCLSPARDFGPRLVIASVYREGKIFTERSWYWLWGCWIASFCGSISGATCYDLFIFTGGESPLNYTEPGARLRHRYRAFRGVGRGRPDQGKEGA